MIKLDIRSALRSRIESMHQLFEKPIAKTMQTN